jgi:DNA gyrase subunit A
MISDDGVIIRIRVSDVRVMGRYATGVKLMRVSGDVRVVAFTRTEHDDSAEIAQIEEPSRLSLPRSLQRQSLRKRTRLLQRSRFPMMRTKSKRKNPTNRTVPGQRRIEVMLF